MRKSVWAIWFHYLSTDTTPQHGLCSNEWCKCLKSKESGKAYSHKNNLPCGVSMAIKPTFRALASPELLEICLHGKTQNPNESFNALIWKRCPKTVFVSNLVVKISALEAAAVFNDGNVARFHILSKLGFTPGVFTEQILQIIDKQRIAKAETSVQNIQKIARQRSREAKRAVEDDEEEMEYGY
ncbi:uncharacterized protein LOC126354821 [Schistocerca gregaria]|uniref:uncharacterized protein LOC126354821 n=1 Tax=Schistocerca gregaria TaxID=7010 RepID=UPI00211E90DE|nr:uncharacterized protein LOC126354821 [Schistocerca gregaria]